MFAIGRLRKNLEDLKGYTILIGLFVVFGGLIQQAKEVDKNNFTVIWLAL